MPIDPSIALGIRPIQLQNPLEQYAQVMQIKDAQSRNRLADLMFSEKQREVGETNALSEMYKGAVNADGKIDRAKLFTSAAQGGLGAKLPAMQKSFADADKAEAEVSAKQIEAATKKLDIAGQAFGYVRANPTVEAAHSAMDYLVQNGVWTAEQGARMKADAAANPAKIPALAEQAFRGALSAKDQLAKIETRNIGGSTQTFSVDPVNNQFKSISSVQNTQSPDNAATNARAAADAAASRAQAERHHQATQGKAPAGYSWAPDGKSLVPIPGGPATKDNAGSEDERKAAGWVAQAEYAYKNMRDVMYDKSDPTGKKLRMDVIKPGIRENTAQGLGFDQAANSLRSADRQRFVQAGSSMAEALLRAATGAGMNEYEAKQKVHEITPQLTDTDENIVQKLNSIPVYLESLKSRAGRALPKPAADGWSIQKVD
jgi:hypothetical protein